MFKVKIILISILSIGFIGIANAQNGNSRVNQSVKNNAQTEQTADGFLKAAINDPTVAALLDSIQANIAQVENWLNRLKSKGCVLSKPEPAQPNLITDAKSAPAPAEKYSSEADKFLNREDTLIFSSGFKDFPDSQIHPRSRSYYQLLKNIHALNGMLLNINHATIQADLDKMRELIDEINDPAKSPKNQLPAPLLNYYKLLVKKYGELYDQTYPN